jgi:hypothetical protein
MSNGAIRSSERAMVQLTPDQDLHLNRIADSICRLGLQQAALLVLEAGRPFAFIGSQLIWLGQPALGLMLPKDRIREAAELLEHPTSVAALIDHIEERLH